MAVWVKVIIIWVAWLVGYVFTLARLENDMLVTGQKELWTPAVFFCIPLWPFFGIVIVARSIAYRARRSEK